MNILKDINELDISIRCANTLKANGVNTILDLLKLSEEKLKSFRSISSFTRKEIREIQDEMLTHEGVRYVISDEKPVNDDMVLTFEYKIWRYKDHPSMLPYWCNDKACVKLIVK